MKLVKIGLVIGLGLAVVSLAGCSSSSADSGPTGPVAATPLKGTVDGKDFVGNVGIARSDGGDSSKKSIDIYDHAVTCDDFAPQTDREILISVAWQAGMTKDFNFSLSGGGQTATFVIDKNGTPDNIIATQGRVEIIDAPTDAGSTGKIRLRAIAGGDSVEGEIPITICE